MTNTKKPILLIVEDDSSLLKVLVEKLKKDPYEVVTANNGKTALEVINSKSPNLIVLDILMPDMNGIEFLKKLRANAQFAETPIIILSNFADSEYVSEAMSYNVFNYLIKSNTSLEEIASFIEEQLNNVNDVS